MRSRTATPALFGTDRLCVLRFISNQQKADAIGMLQGVFSLLRFRYVSRDMRDYDVKSVWFASELEGLP